MMNLSSPLTKLMSCRNAATEQGGTFMSACILGAPATRRCQTASTPSGATASLVPRETVSRRRPTRSENHPGARSGRTNAGTWTS